MSNTTTNPTPKSTFTPEQEDAINARGSFAIVSAAAGSGKTTVLIEKLIRLLSDEKNGLRADRLIIVTFTNDAAGQIVRKLNIALNKAISACGSDPANSEKKSWLIKQQSYLGAAKISTINAFCFNLLRSNSGVLGIPSDFRIIDENEGTVMLLEAFEKTADEHFADPEKSKAVTELFSFFRYFSNNNLNKADKYKELLDFRSFLMAIPYYKERFIKPFIEEYSKHTEVPFDPMNTYYGKMFCRKVHDILYDTNTKNLFDHIYGIYSPYINNPAFDDSLQRAKSVKRAADYHNAMKKALTILNDYYTLQPASEWEKTIRTPDASCNFFRSDLSLKTQKDTVKKIFTVASCNANTDDFVSKCREFGKLISTLYDLPADCTANDLCSDYKAHHHMLTLISDFIEEVNVKYTEIKAEKNGLTFEDGEQLALKLLGKLDENGNIVKTAEAEKLSNEYGFVMIDEFQDSNDLQDTIFRLLSKDGTSTVNGKNMFVVGDIKQSIYNFRLANPKLFADYLKNSTPYSPNTQTDDPKNILLNKNFRSSPNVINFVNMLFGHIMSEKCGGIEYDNTQKLIFSDDVWLKGNAEKTAQITGLAPDDILKMTDEINGLETELLLIDSSNAPFSYSRNNNTQSNNNSDNTSQTAAHQASDEEEELSSKITEARVVALKIKRLLESRRQLSPRDICILCSKNADAPYFEEELRHLGIRSALDNRTSYLESREISIMINFLRILDNPNNSLAMTGCLLSPLFMFSPDDLAVLTILRGSKSLYSAIHEINRADDKMLGEISRYSSIPVQALRELSEKVRLFCDVYSRIRKNSSVMSIEDTIRCIYSETEIVALMSLYSNGAGRRANLAMLPEYARSYEQNVTCGTGGIYGFISYIDTMSPNKLDYSAVSASSEADDAVAIKTIHKSKGLEYPVVFLCCTNKNMRGDSGSVWYSNECGAAFTVYDDASRTSARSLPASLIYNDKKSELVSERMRLLYVALTRAKHKLFISGTLPMKNENGTVGCINTNPADIAYTDFECELTNSPPDETLQKYLQKYFCNILTEDKKMIPDAMSSTDYTMLIWILAALTAEGKIPYFGGTPQNNNTSAVKIMAEHIDTKQYEKLFTDITPDNTANKNADPDKILHEELKNLNEYDISDKFRADRIKRDIPAKLTVTEITKRAHELIYEETEYTPDRSAMPEKDVDKKFAPSPKISLQKKEKIRLSAAERGTAVHSFMQYADLKSLEKAIQSGENDPVGNEAHRLALEGHISEVYADYIAGSKKVCRRIEGFFTSELWQNCYSCTSDENILSEQPFMAKISDIFAKNSAKGLDERVRTYYNEYYDDTFVQGIADCIVKTEDGFILIDYKTNEGKSNEELLELYSVQLILYTMIFEMIYGLPQGSGKAYIYTLGRDSNADCTIEVPR